MAANKVSAYRCLSGLSKTGGTTNGTTGIDHIVAEKIAGEANILVLRISLWACYHVGPPLIPLLVMEFSWKKKATPVGEVESFHLRA
jgi:hypothetical protein